MNATLLKRIAALSTPDLTTAPTTAPAPNLTPDSTSDSTPNPPKRRRPKQQPYLPDSWCNLLLDAIKLSCGRERESSNVQRSISLIYAAQQLYDLFNCQIDNPHAQSTVVTSAWYGKREGAAEHEFIVLHIEDLNIPGLENCMVIERNPPNTQSTTVFSFPIARDTFKVAYDGDLDRLLRESSLTPHQKLEEISFLTQKPLYLHELVILVNHVSSGHRRYIPMDTNCYWFSGLIWECLRNLHPTAEHKAYPLAGRKGRFGFLRTIPNPIQVRSVLRDIANDPLNPNVYESESETGELEETSPTSIQTSIEPDTRRDVTA